MDQTAGHLISTGIRAAICSTVSQTPPSVARDARCRVMPLREIRLLVAISIAP
jgi:hypothetical protein